MCTTPHPVTPPPTGEQLAAQVQQWMDRLGYGHLDCWADPELLDHLHSHAMQALDADGTPEAQLADVAVARVADTLVVLYGGASTPPPTVADETTCACGQWPLAEYGPHCPSCARPLDMQGVAAIAEAYQLGDAITSQIGHLLELWANPSLEDVWGLNINAVTRIEEKLLPVLRQYAPAAASELDQAISFWKEG